MFTALIAISPTSLPKLGKKMIFQRSVKRQNKRQLNLSNAEIKCLNELVKRKDIVIHSADNRGSVVMSLEQYDNSIKAQLRDIDCYTLLTHNPMKEHKAEIDQILGSGLSRRWITEKGKRVFDCTTSKMSRVSRAS